KHEIIRPDALERLRGVGDPTFEGAALGTTLADTQSDGFLALATKLPIPVTFKHDELVAIADGINDQVPIDQEKVEHAIHLFEKYATEICAALLLAALPQAYAAAWASRVLTATARLQSDFRRRIVQTAQFLLFVMRAPTAGTCVDDL